MNSRSWVEVYLPAVVHNIRTIRSRAKAPKFLFVVKSNSYGLGAVPIARATSNIVDFFGVAYLDEAVKLRESGIKNPILILLPVFDPIEIKEAILNKIRLTISHREQLLLVEEISRKLSMEAYLHLEIDTGMTRTGVKPDKLDEILTEWLHYPYLRMEGVFTHFPNAEKDTQYTREQLNRFLRLVEKIPPPLKPKIKHAANSAGFLNVEESHLDMLRIGILAYGSLPDPTMDKNIDIHPTFSFKTRVVSVRDVEKGQGVSYGHTFIAPKKMRIATLSVGYDDGYLRYLSNRGEVLIRGKRAKVVGNVTMNLSMVDVTHIEDVRIGDVAVLVGKDRDEFISVESVAERAGTIPYVVMTSINRELPRIYMGEEGLELLTLFPQRP